MEHWHHEWMKYTISRKIRSLINATKQFARLCDHCFKFWPLLCLQGRTERKDTHILLAFGDITYFEGLNSCIVLCFDCNKNIEVIFTVQCGKRL